MLETLFDAWLTLWIICIIAMAPFILGVMIRHYVLEMMLRHERKRH